MAADHFIRLATLAQDDKPIKTIDRWNYPTLTAKCAAKVGHHSLVPKCEGPGAPIIKLLGVGGEGVCFAVHLLGGDGVGEEDYTVAEVGGLIFLESQVQGR